MSTREEVLRVLRAQISTMTHGQVGCMAREVYLGDDVGCTVGNTQKTQESAPSDTDRLGVIYLHAGDR